jgi:hypothetical protein
MAMNLRLRPHAEEALRAEAQRSHRSQQEVLRDAVDHYLGLGHASEPARRSSGPTDDLVVTGRIRPPRTPYRRVEPDAEHAPGTSSLTLLDRDDRL